MTWMTKNLRREKFCQSVPVHVVESFVGLPHDMLKPTLALANTELYKTITLYLKEKKMSQKELKYVN